MKRFFIALALFAAAIWILRRLAGWRDAATEVRAAPGARRRQAGRHDQAVTELVRDRVCNTYIPKDKALTLEEYGEHGEPGQPSKTGRIHYFCSEPCRSRHVARAPRHVNVA